MNNISLRQIQKQQNLLEAQRIAISKGGACLSTSYVNNRTKLDFRCKFNHGWSANLDSIKNMESWCPHCNKYSRGPNKHKFIIENAKKIAKKRGGECLTTTIKKTTDKFKWKCVLNHQWEAVYYNVVDLGSWCPYCNCSVSENICREYFEFVFQEQFIKVRPDFLINISGWKMELDGYCAKLGIAFEHNGIQHYNSKSTFYKNLELFEEARQRDILKYQLCTENNTKLIVIPALFSMVKLCDLSSFLQKEFDKQNIIYSVDRLINVKYDTFKIYKPNIITIDDVNNFVKIKNGVCLSDVYINNQEKLLFKCEFGHIWKAAFSKIKLGRWCPKCSYISRANNRRQDISIYKNAAIKKGGACLSETVFGCNDVLIFKCEFDHIFEARGMYITSTDQWCPQCAKIKNSKRTRNEKGRYF